MNRCLHAYTEPTPRVGYPAYINVSLDAAGLVVVTVRGNGAASAMIGVTPTEMRALCRDVLGALSDAPAGDGG